MDTRGIETADLFQPALDALPHGILLVDAGGTIVLVNRELERQFGYRRDELVGQSVDILVPEGLRLVHQAHRAAFAQAPEARSMGAGRELFGRHKDGSRIAVEVLLNPTETAEGRFVLACVEDHTRRNRLEDTRQLVLEEQLEFERLVAELSGQFINLPSDQIDDAIRDALRRIGEALDLDRATFNKIAPDGLLFDPVSWERSGIPPLPAPVWARERFPWALDRLLAGDVIAFSTPGDIPSEIDRKSYLAFGTRSALIVPLSVAGTVIGAVGFNTVRAERAWPPEISHRLGMVASVFAQVLARRQSDESLRAALAELQRLKHDLNVENVYLRREARDLPEPSHIVGHSPAVQRVLAQIDQVAPTDSSVLLLGETGTGKELFATRIHAIGRRRHRAMVRVNCAAIPATLIESELFGREKGAFTGALARQVGRFELADGSTIFLDEIGDLPSDVQVKLLRVLEQKQIERLGSPRPTKVDVRIIAATHRNLEQLIAEGAFREDLYYRLNVFPIRVPPLRERAEDIPQLAWRFVEEFSKAFGKRIESISSDSLTALHLYSWPGNIRELRNVVERAMITASGPRLTIPPPHPSAAAVKRSPKLVDVEREHIRSVLERTGWRIRGAGGAADQLGLKPTTLETRMAKLGLKRPGHA